MELPIRLHGHDRRLRADAAGSLLRIPESYANLPIAQYPDVGPYAVQSTGVQP